jgi:hypothetical protein
MLGIYISPIMMTWMMELGLQSSYLPFIPSLVAFALILPLRFVCGAWLKSESERIGRNPWVWFWTGVIFDLIGVIAFYAYMTYRKSMKSQLVGGDQ